MAGARCVVVQATATATLLYREMSMRPTTRKTWYLERPIQVRTSSSMENRQLETNPIIKVL